MLEEGDKPVHSPGRGKGGNGEGPHGVQPKGGEPRAWGEEMCRGFGGKIAEPAKGVTVGFPEATVVAQVVMPSR